MVASGPSSNYDEADFNHGLLDAMQAYAQSVHLVVNPTDISNLGAILKKGLADFELFYRVYRDILAETGEIA